MLYQISYELKKADKDYSELYLAIKKLGNKYAHPMETVWFVDSNSNLSEVSKSLMPYIDPISDKLLVTQILVNGLGGRASTDFWKWIKVCFGI